MGLTKQEKAKKTEQKAYTQSGLARKMGLTRQAISGAVKAGRLALNDDGKIDPSHETNKKFFYYHKTSIKASGKNGRGHPLRMVADDSLDALSGNTVERGRELDNLIKEAKLKAAQIKNAETMGKLIPVEMVSRSYSILAALLNENFRSFDERNGEELYALARAKEEREFSRELADRIGDSMAVVLSGLRKEMEKQEQKKDQNGEQVQ